MQLWQKVRRFSLRLPSTHRQAAMATGRGPLLLPIELGVVCGCGVPGEPTASSPSQGMSQSQVREPWGCV